MSTLNRVFLMGNLTRDPEVRYTPSGTAVGDLGLAVNESYKNKAGETVESTVFVDVEVWARQAETCAEYLYKGSPVFVEGRLKLDQWENQQGEKRSKLRVRADRVQFLGAPKRDGASDAPSSAPSAPQEASTPTGDDDDIPF
ncbi:single-stranded DNA-binding protein [Tichowtungia aerotolerans]|uniref:Single-stranded DNA-binding protein n=1 Tax=Tichowtungia aerotolerans TaxID=2697043 RepID=A0A6P1M680_9BACT|nr:single-stranded DNA-binding protein [Tichowtungia aerotolerans]QHI68513.1 single-stranded DNA-binding protein [Tichowtungia aerotolerans]